MDFVRAANRSLEGRSIIALQSTNRDRSRSRIVARLVDGVVTTPRAEADLVVTEHGIVELRGRTLAERARVLIIKTAEFEITQFSAQQIGVPTPARGQFIVGQAIGLFLLLAPALRDDHRDRNPTRIHSVVDCAEAACAATGQKVSPS
jgi:hypothetical protein